jgi:DNA-binding CsgD family transcriptional regulator/PAS domain-containing protein
MLPSEGAFSRLLERLYDAAADASLWDSFLLELTRTAHAQAAALVMHDTTHAVHTVLRDWGLNPDLKKLYQEYYGKIDEWALKAPKFSDQKNLGWVGTSEQVCPFEELVNTEYYNDFLIPSDVPYAMFGMIERRESRMASVSVYRSAKVGAFESSELELLRLLDPHIRRAFRLHIQLSEMKARTEGLERALDLFPTAVVLLGMVGDIFLMNRSAATLIQRNDGLLATREGLRAESIEESAILQKVVADAVATGAGKGVGPGGTVKISRRTGPALHVLITPVRNLPIDQMQSVAAIAFVADSTQRVRPGSEALRDLFGLTAAECRVALLLADGKSPREITQMLGVTSNTVKSQIASTYSKTGAARQTQLVRLLLTLAVQPHADAGSGSA